jgi:hypothetical protein
MKKITVVIITCIGFLFSCSDDPAVDKTGDSKANKKKLLVKSATDGPFIGAIETPDYLLKLHRAFIYETTGNEVVAGTKPKEGYKFIYLDVSLKNKSSQKLDGGFLFIGLTVKDEKGTEYKKPAAALASYITEHPQEDNGAEYGALWKTFKPQEFHRAIVYAVEVPKGINEFVLSMPVAPRAKERKELKFIL